MPVFIDERAQPVVRGFLHQAAQTNSDGLVLTHGAGSNCHSKLLIAVAGAFTEAGFAVLRCDLPFRQQRPHGPPFPGGAASDRAGLKRAVEAIRTVVPGRVFLGGHSYGGRQATLLCAEDDAAGRLADGLLLLSYPLHPPRKPAQLRTAHFPKLATPALFVHGSRDPFGSLDEMKAALSLIPAKSTMLEVPGASHELLGTKKNLEDLPADMVKAFLAFFR